MADEAERRASEIASGRGGAPKPMARGRDDGLTSASDLVKNYQIHIVELTNHSEDNPRKFEIQSVSAGDFYAEFGTPILALLAEKDVDITDKDAVGDYINNEMSTSDRAKLGLLDENFAKMRRIICQGVVSVAFVVKNQIDCEDDEVSVNLLSALEQIELFNAIIRLSVPEVDANLFRPNDGDEQS